MEYSATKQISCPICLLNSDIFKLNDSLLDTAAKIWFCLTKQALSNLYVFKSQNMWNCNLFKNLSLIKNSNCKLLDKLAIRMNIMIDYAIFCPIYKTVCPICWTVCPICWIICPIWIYNSLLMRENLSRKHGLKFSFVRPDMFYPDLPGPKVSIVCSP